MLAIELAIDDQLDRATGLVLAVKTAADDFFTDIKKTIAAVDLNSTTVLLSDLGSKLLAIANSKYRHKSLVYDKHTLPITEQVLSKHFESTKSIVARTKANHKTVKRISSLCAATSYQINVEGAWAALRSLCGRIETIPLARCLTMWEGQR